MLKYRVTIDFEIDYDLLGESLCDTVTADICDSLCNVMDSFDDYINTTNTEMILVI